MGNIDSQELLQLLLPRCGNQRRFYVGLAIAVASTTAFLLDTFWHKDGHTLSSMLPFLCVCAAGIGSMWHVARLARENTEIGKKCAELARKVGLL